MAPPPASIATREGDRIVLPGLATAHSHAFQRALRGRTHRKTAGGTSFWSWRSLMYEVAEKLDPETIGAISRYAFAELATCGVTAVGEFHYVHHQPGGVQYADRTTLSDAVIRAALDVGVRVTLLRVVYERAGAGKAVEQAQRRFVDARPDDALEDVAALRKRYDNHPLVRVGIAPHSLRAVTLDTIRRAHAGTREANLPFHMHVSEQPREIEECVAEHGKRPVELLASESVLDGRFVAVHATHLAENEAAALGSAKSFACVCRSTERDLGDGLPNIAALARAGARFCAGVDSHALSDPFEELRAIELDERARTQSRIAGLEANALLTAGTHDGYAAIGWEGFAEKDRVLLAADDPALVGATDDLLDDAVAFCASARAVREVWVADQRIVDGGEHVRMPEYREDYVTALAKLGLR